MPVATQPAVSSSSALSIEDILTTEALEQRPARLPDSEGENRALVGLAQRLADQPDTVLQLLVDEVLELTGADSSGISIGETFDGKGIFRWHATAGEFRRYCGGTMPREFSPCGTVLDFKKTLLMEDAVRFYPYISQLSEPCKEILLVPFARNGELVGTVWAVAHTERKKFDAEDRRLIASLTSFASLTIKALSDVSALQIVHQRQTEFLATLAHELRNPLAPLKNGMHILKTSGAAGDDRILGMMDRQLNHMVHLIDDLMDVSRIASGKVELKVAQADLVEIIAGAVESCGPRLRTAGHEISVSAPVNGVIVDADPIRLAQIISNLLANATKYTPAGGKISIEVDAGGSLAVVRVRDSGIGLEKDKLEHIFDMFGQVDQTINQAEGGLGIGLSLAKTLVEMHGGTIRAESEGLGKGSTFVIELPVRESGHPASANDIAPAAPLQANFRPLNIHIVEDNRDNALSLKLVLEMEGHSVKCAHTGKAGMAAVMKDVPDVVLLDIGLPDMTGYDVVRALRQESALENTLILALSGWGSEADKEKAISAGFDFHLTKPVDPSRLNELMFMPASGFDRRIQA